MRTILVLTALLLAGCREIRGDDLYVLGIVNSVLLVVIVALIANVSDELTAIKRELREWLDPEGK
jgi:hypothetical protein